MNEHDRMPGQADLETRVRSWIEHDTASREPAALYGSVMASIASAKPRPAVLVARRNRASLTAEERSPLRRLALVALLLLLLVATLAVGVLVGSQLRSPEPATPSRGAFVSGGVLPEELGWLLRPGVAALQDGRVLIAGGGQEAALAAVYDPSSGTFGEPIRLPAMHQGATATTLPDGRVLITGGNDGMTGALLAAATLFDPATGAATSTGSLATARDHHTATLLDDGRVLVVGGYQAIGDEENGYRYEPIASAEVYDPSTGTFSPTGTLATPRASHSATRLADGRVAVIGGYSTIDVDTGETIVVPTAEVYDPARGSFQTVGSLVTPRSGHGAVMLGDGRVLVVGGGRVSPRPFPQDLPFLASAEWFDPSSGTFTATPGSMATERASPLTALLRDGTVLVVGGNNGFGTPRSAERFDPVTGTFSTVGTTVGTHESGNAVVLEDGQVFLPGLGQGPEGATEVFDPDGIPTEPRASPSAAGVATASVERVDAVPLGTEQSVTLLQDGRVLIAGGYDGETNDLSGTAGIYDPTAGSWDPTGSMIAARAEHLAFPRTDGRVLLFDTWFGSDVRSEQYDPGSGRFEPLDPTIANAIDGWQVVDVSGLRPGRLVLVSDDRERSGDDKRSMTVLDLVTGMLTPAGSACRYRGGAVELADGRILEGCASRPGATIYDPASGASMAAAGIKDEFWPLHRLRDGRVLGATPQGGEVDAVRLTASLVYDAATGVLTPIVADDQVSPMAGSIVELDDGRLLMVGGNLGNVSSAIRILDPTTWEYRDVGDLLAPRADAAAIRLPDGRVLVVGGARRSPDRTDAVPSGAEIIDPADFGKG